MFCILCAIGFVPRTIPTASAMICTQINTDVSVGQTDVTLGGPVSVLHAYLRQAGYLAAGSSGHFGSGTLAAVKAFQSANGISSTGYVGPVTRLAISRKTCGTVSAIASSTITVISPNMPVVSPSPVAVIVSVTSPAVGQVLSLGSTTPIRWNAQPANIYNILLEQPGGMGAGFIAMSQNPVAGQNQYLWNVGNVYSSQTNLTQTVAPGTYRIRLQSASYGASLTDEVSGWFTIIAQPFAANSVIPSSVYADNATPVVLFGSGFTQSTNVYFDTNQSGTRANNAYISPNGTVLVFTVPTGVAVGAHTLYINNGSVTPASLPFTVNATQ